MKNPFKQFFAWLISKDKPLSDKPAPAKPKRRYLKDVEAGEYIRIEWHKIKGRISFIKVLSNDPETKTIFLEMKWRNYKVAHCEEYERFVLRYDAEELKDFHLLNTAVESNSDDKPDDDLDDNDIAALQKKINDCLESGEHDKIDALQKKIDKLLKK